MAGVPQMQRQTSDYYMQAMNNGMAAVPAHLRGEMAPSPRSGSPAQYQMPVNGSAQRPPLTSNPSSGYNPPQILEPSAAPHGGQQHNGSATNSPHMGHAMGWQSPHNGLSANGQQPQYHYGDANGNYGVNTAAQMYYDQQRPHSTGPMDYNGQIRGQEMWAQHQS
jgi:hypothetical protein